MGWFDAFGSVEDLIDEKLYYIKHKLYDWIEMIAFHVISLHEAATGVGKTIWSDLELWLDQRIEDFLPEVFLKIISARQLAQFLHDSLKIELEQKIKAASGLPEQVITLVLKQLEPKIVSARQYAEYLTDTLEIELGKQMKTVKAYAKGLQTEALADVDKRIGLVIAAIANMDEVAGAARLKFYQRLKGIIDAVEQEAKDNLKEFSAYFRTQIALLEKASKNARATLDNKLSSAIDVVETASKAARNVLEKNLNKVLDVLEKEAKEAREVIEGTLIQIIEGVEDALEQALTDLERTFRGLLDVVIDRVGDLEGWVNNASKWFDKELNKYQSRVVDWIVDGFEGILDRVFK